MASEIWIPLSLVGLIAGLVVGGSRRAARRKRLAHEAQVLTERTRRERASETIAEKLRETDPEFDIAAFEDRGARAFLAVQ